MIKVFSPQLGLSPKSFMGGEVYDYQIINQLCHSGVRFDVILPAGRPYQKNPNLHVQYLPIKSIFPPHIFNLIAWPFIFANYRKIKFDILRIHSPYFLGFAAYVFKKKYPKTKIVTQVLLEETAFDREYVLRKTIHIYDHIFVLTDFLKKRLIDKYHISPSKISIMYGGIDEYLKPQPKDQILVKKYNLQGKVVLLNVGRLIPRKNVIFLLEVFQSLLKKNPNIVLIYCGNGYQKEVLLKKIEQENIKNVYIFDSVYGDEKNKLFNLADIFLFPTLGEGFGLVAAEAMACAKPVIASDNTSLPEIIKNGADGFLVKTNDTKQWIRKIDELINNQKLRKTMSQNALKSVQRFTWQNVAQVHLDVFNKLIND